MAEFPNYAQLSNLAMIEELYRKYVENPEDVDASWRHFFEGIDFAAVLYKKGGAEDCRGLKILELIEAYRRYGHLLVQVNPIETGELQVPELELKALGFAESELGESFPTLGFCGKKEAKLGEIIEGLRGVYCSRIGFEYMGLGRELEEWVQSCIEPELVVRLSPEEKQLILEQLGRSEIFEKFLNTKYQGQTRFSVEGVETLIPMLSELIAVGADLGMEEFVIGMAHRARLNVLANVLNKPYPILFKEFEDTIPFSFDESSDVKYHKGFSAEVKTIRGKQVHLSLSANSSCLESTDPIVLGQVRAKQVLKGDEEKRRVGAILIHGDAALAGQGVVYETLQMMRLEGFSIGGTIHIVTNNQIGYTTLPGEGRSTRYCTDIAKTFGVPVFHVNAEDPEAALFATRLAVEIRQKFQCDVFIDLNGYRKYGHNEGDEPSYTQPLQYKLIRSKKSVRELYLERLRQEGLVEQKIAETFEAMLAEAHAKGKIEEPIELTERFGGKAEEFAQPPAETLFQPVDTRVSADVLKQVLNAFCLIPKAFHLHDKLAKWLEARKAMERIDWATGECLAFGSLACEGVAVRLAGQDVARGTFSQRHAGWFDQETGERYLPFAHLKEGQARVDVYNTILSEYAALGFELGYSWATLKGLTMWEAQYGDFVIGGQIPIDHYIVSAEQKWNRYSALVLLLPHGYEGMGPEHSSGRIERFLQLAANYNIQVAYPTTPAQYFHVLRRQVKRQIRKPLILFTPKSLLRLPANTSSLEDFTSKGFEEILDDPAPPKVVKRLFFCSGKIYYDLLEVRKEFPDAALIRIEQIYPLHKEKLQKILAKYKEVQECSWVQEEPENMGAFEHLFPQLQPLFPKWRHVGRPRSGATATGSRKRHKEEQAAIFKALK